MRAFSRMRFRNSKNDDEATNKVEEKEKKNVIENGRISPSFIPKFSGAKHSPRKRMTTFNNSSLTRTMNKVSLEINRIELSNISSIDRQIDCIFCTLRVGSDREVCFSSSLATKRNNYLIFTFSKNETALSNISINEYSARHALLSIKSTSKDGTLLGEASISLGTNSQDPSSHHKIVVLKDRKRVGDAYYALSRPVEGFLDDSASEDGDQASATPSPFTKPLPMQLTANVSPVATSLDFTDSPAPVSVSKLLQSPNSPVRTSHISGNARTLLTLQNTIAHNQTASTNSISLPQIDVENNKQLAPNNIEIDKQPGSVRNLKEIDDFSIQKSLEIESLYEENHNQNDDMHNLLLSPILPQRTSTSDMLLSPITFPSPCKPEASEPAVEEYVVKQETPVAVLLVSENQPLETSPLTSSKDTAIVADSTNQILLNHSPVVVSLVSSTPMTQRDTTHDPAISTTIPATMGLVSATPSMTVLGSVNRLLLRQQLCQQQRQSNLCASTPFSPGTHSSNNINSNTANNISNSVHSSLRRTLAQVKERLQRLQPTPSTVDVEGISSSSSFSATPLSCEENSGNKRVRRRLSLTSNSTISPVLAESFTPTSGVIDNHDVNNNEQHSETFSSPAVCLLDDLVDEIPVKMHEKEIEKEVSLFEPNDSFEANYQAINDCLEKKLAIVANNIDYFYGENTSNKKKPDQEYSWTRIMLFLLSILTLLTSVTVVKAVYGMHHTSHIFSNNNITENMKPSVGAVSSVSAGDVSFQFSLFSPSDMTMNMEGKEELPFSLSVQLQVLTLPISPRKDNIIHNNRNNGETDGVSPVCFHWISSPTPPASAVYSQQTTSLTKKTTNHNTNILWLRMKLWFQNFTKRVQSRFRSSRKLKSLPTHTQNTISNSINNNLVDSVQGIVRMGDCPSVFTGKGNPSSWRLRPTAKPTTAFHLQYMGWLPSVAMMSTPQSWCLSVTPAYTSELRPCDAADSTTWRFVDNRLTAEIHVHTHEVEDDRNNTMKAKETVELIWQWNAQYRTNAVGFQKQQDKDNANINKISIEIGLVSWLPVTNTQGASNIIQYQRQRIDSII